MSDADLLSQDEIDALLHGVDGGDVETEGGLDGSSGETTGYDFTSQDRIIRGRMPTLEMVNERFARYFRSQSYLIFYVVPLRYRLRAFKCLSFQNMFTAYLCQQI